MNREAFLARVREAAQRGATYRVGESPQPRALGEGYVGAGGRDHAEALRDEIAMVGGYPQLFSTWPELLAGIATLLEQFKPATALCWEHPLLTRIGLDELLSSAGCRRVGHAQLRCLEQSERRAAMLACDLGITSVDFAVAETGSLVLEHRPTRERTASLLPPRHLAIVAADQVVPDVFDVFDRWNERGAEGLPSNVAFVTGPSKTGDLELQLTTGVHGPGEWHVLICRQPAP